jgi:hypothetical protein
VGSIMVGSCNDAQTRSPRSPEPFGRRGQDEITDGGSKSRGVMMCSDGCIVTCHMSHSTPSAQWLPPLAGSHCLLSEPRSVLGLLVSLASRAMALILSRAPCSNFHRVSIRQRHQPSRRRRPSLRYRLGIASSTAFSSA